MAAITLDIAGNTRQLDRDIQKTVNQVYTINLKTKGDQPLGRITGQVNEFNKSLDASNARVIAFGASAGIIFGIERAFGALVSATIEVQKSLQDINVILNASQQQLQAFGKELFSIAKNTGQSFQEVAKAATEFSRQGLGVEETLKRTSEALILSRLSGLDAAKSVESLTAAVNSFASQAVTATEVVNKFATVDAAFAVSSADLADAIARVGSSAAQSGVSLNELIAIVTAAQQTTARGGAVIGNSFKTIFTRLQREKVVDLLESLGISSTDSSGQVKSTIQLLQDLGSVYDNLGSQQQAYVAEQVGGVFQINILKAALSDLGKEYSIYSSALNVAAGATDQAIRRNEELNKTYAAQINALQQNATQLAAAGGERLLGPSIDRLVGGTNTLLEGLGEGDGQGIGETLGKGILDGLGQFIAGPGLALIGGVLLKLFSDLAKFATGSVQQLLGLNTAANQQKDLQASISQILSKNPQLLQAALQGQQGLNQAANQLLANLQKQTVELQKQSQVAAQIAKAFMSQAGVRMSGGIPTVPTKPSKAGGYIPNFASNKDKRNEMFGAYQAGYEPGRIYNKRLFDGQGGSFMATVNGAESIDTVTGPNGNKGTFVIPPNAAKGYVPNFADKNKSRANFAIGGIVAKGPDPTQIEKISDSKEKSLEDQAKELIANFTSQYTNTLSPLGRQVGTDEIKQGFNTIPGAKGALNGVIGSIFEVGISSALDYRAAAREKGGDFDVRGGGNLGLIQKLFGVSTPLADFKVNAGAGNVKSFIDKILDEEGAGKFEDTEVIRNSQQIAKRELKAIDEKEAVRLGIVDKNGSGIPGTEWFPKGTGRGYDLKQTISNASPDIKNKIQKLYNERLTETRGRFGYLGTEEYRKVQAQGTPQKLAKGGTGEEGQEKPASYWASKYGYLVPPLAKPGEGTRIFYNPKTKGAARGYLPNFAAIQDAVNRERSAGIPSNQIYLAQDKALMGVNPMGLGVFNKRDEPTRQSRKDAMRQRGFAKGYVPNFAIGEPDIQGTDAGTATAAIAAQLSGVAFAFAFTGNEFKEELQKLTETTKENNKSQRTRLAQEIRLQRVLGKKEGVSGKEINQSIREQFGQRLETAPNKNQGPGFAAKGKAFLGANALGLAIAAPILGETIKNVLGRESKGARVGGAAASAAGQIGSFAATGATVGGAPGAVIGGAVGAILTIPSVVNEFTTKLPDLTAAADKASQDLTKFGDVGQRLLTSSSEISRLVTSGDSQELINKAQNDYVKALSELSTTDRARLSSAAQVGKLEEEYAKILKEKVEETRSTERFVKLQSLEEQKDLGIFAGGFDTDPETRGGRANSELIENSIKGFFTTPTALPENLKEQVRSGKLTEQQAILQNFQEGKNVGIPDLQNLIKNSLQSGLTTFGVSDSNLTQLENILQTTLPESKTKAEDINQLLALADDGGAAFLNIIMSVIKALDEGPEALKQAIEQGEKDKQANIERTKALEDSRAAIEAQLSALDANVAIQNLLQATLENTAESFRGLADDINVSRQFVEPADTLEKIIGPETDPAMRLRAQSDLALLGKDERATKVASGLEFKDEIRGILEKPFQENIGEILKKGSEGPSAITGDKEAIEKQTKELMANTQSEYAKLNQVMSGVENLMGDFLTGQASSEQLLSGIEGQLSQVGIETGRGSQISDKIKTTIAKFSAKSVQEYVRAFQQRAKLANETKQAILQDKINQALKAFGGFEGFKNRPEEEKNYIERITPDLKKIEEIRSSPTFRYNNPESREEQRRQSPELGRAYANVYSELIDQSGGAFRNVIQRSIDQGRQQTGVESRSGKAGASALGGFDDIVEGRAEDLRQQLKLAEDQLKVTTDPTLKRDLQGFIDEINKLGIDRIAKLQTMQEFGVARQSDYSEIYGEFESQSLEKLKEISPELAASLEDAISLSDDPLVAEAQLQSNLQGQMIGYLGPIQEALIQIAKVGGVGEKGSPTEIMPYKPKLTPEQEAKANLFREESEKKKTEKTGEKKPEAETKQLPKKGETVPETQNNINAQIQKAQEKGIPQQNKTIAEIEAETTRKRDQKYLTSPLAPRNRTTGQKFQSIEEVDAEMNKALALGAMNPEQKEYYNVLKNFKRNLDPTGGADGRRAMFMYDDANPQITQPRIDQRMGITPTTTTQPPTIPSTQAVDTTQLAPTLNQLTAQLSSFGNELTTIFTNIQGQGPGTNPNTQFNETSYKKVEEPTAAQESFATVEASLNNNSTAVSTLSTNVQTLNTSITTLINTFSNTNNQQNNPAVSNANQAGTTSALAPSATAGNTNTNIGPFNTVVNATIGNDFDTKLNQAINSLRSEIYGKLNVKSPPQQR